MISDSTGARGVSLSHCPIWNPSLQFSFPLCSHTRSLSHSSCCAFLGKDFLGIIPKPHPHQSHNWCYVRQNHQMILNRYLSCQEDRAKDLGFFCCLISHLTQHPEIDFENFSAFQPSSLEPHATFHCTQLQFPQGFSFASIGSLHYRPGQSTYPMMDSLSNWLLPRIPNHKHHRCSVSHEEYTPAQEDLSQDINSIDNGSFLRGVRATSLHWFKSPSLAVPGEEPCTKSQGRPDMSGRQLVGEHEPPSSSKGI